MKWFRLASAILLGGCVSSPPTPPIGESSPSHDHVVDTGSYRGKYIRMDLAELQRSAARLTGRNIATSGRIVTLPEPGVAIIARASESVGMEPQILVRGISAVVWQRLMTDQTVSLRGQVQRAQALTDRNVDAVVQAHWVRQASVSH